MIQPLGSQVIIRTIPQESWKGIIIPDSAKKSTVVGDDNSIINFVEAEVVAVGPGMRIKDSKLFDDMADAIQGSLRLHPTPSDEWRRQLRETATTLNDRLNAETFERIPLTVKPGDRILYHPAVQRFDRNISGALSELEGNCFIIREDSILAVIEE